MMAFLCICGILSLGIAFAILENPIMVLPIFVGMVVIICIIWGIIEEIFKKIRSVISRNKKQNYGSFKNIKRCPKCNLAVNIKAEKCPKCNYRFGYF